MRLFIAIKIPKSIREEAARLGNKLSIPCVKWVKSDNIHLTIKFLGEVKENKSECGQASLEDVKKVLEKLAKDFFRFEMNLKGVGAFPSFDRPNVIWIGVDKGKEEVVSMMEKLEEDFLKIGFQKEKREPHPHITIGRVKSKIKNQKLNIKVCDFKSEIFWVDEIYLIKSELRPEGPIYTDIGEYKLGRV